MGDRHPWRNTSPWQHGIAGAVHLFGGPESNYTSRQSIVGGGGGGLIVRCEGAQMQYRSSWMTDELELFRDQFRKFLAKDLAPHAEKWREQKMVDRSPGGRWAKWAHCCRACRKPMAASAPPSPMRPPSRGHRDRGAGSDDRRLRAQRHRRALHPQLRLRGAEAALAAEDGERRVRRRDRDDRTRHRLRSAGRAAPRRASRATTTSSTARRPLSPTARPPT